MKTYKMLKTVPGSRDGIKVESFIEGKTYQIEPDLAEQFYHLGAVEEISANPADSRETKVIFPEETKSEKPLHKMSKAELVTHAMALGLELVPDSMTIKEMLAAIDAHTASA